jgi:hypothetical protein
MNDAARKGDTVKPFNERESWDLLMKLLGEDWVDMDRRGLIKASEEFAAKELLKDLGGVCYLSRPLVYKANNFSSHWQFNKPRNSSRIHTSQARPLTLSMKLINTIDKPFLPDNPESALRLFTHLILCGALPSTVYLETLAIY